MDSRISMVNSTVPFHTPDISDIGLPQQHVPGQSNAHRPTAQVAQVRSEQTGFPARARQTARASSPHAESQTQIFSSDNDANSASAPRASARHEAGLSVSDATRGADGDISDAHQSWIHENRMEGDRFARRLSRKWDAIFLLKNPS